jgi:hypothetical protein
MENQGAPMSEDAHLHKDEQIELLEARYAELATAVRALLASGIDTNLLSPHFKSRLEQLSRERT